MDKWQQIASLFRLLVSYNGRQLCLLFSSASLSLSPSLPFFMNALAKVVRGVETTNEYTCPVTRRVPQSLSLWHCSFLSLPRPVCALESDAVEARRERKKSNRNEKQITEMLQNEKGYTLTIAKAFTIATWWHLFIELWHEEMFLPHQAACVTRTRGVTNASVRFFTLCPFISYPFCRLLLYSHNL